MVKIWGSFKFKPLPDSIESCWYVYSYKIVHLIKVHNLIAMLKICVYTPGVRIQNVEMSMAWLRITENNEVWSM